MALRLNRTEVHRPEGKPVNVVRKPGHIFVCADACCCGQVESGHAPVPLDLLQSEWDRRRLRNRVHLTTGGCLGPCELANVAMLLFDGRSVWFHSFQSPNQVIALYDYVEEMLAAGAFLEPPPELASYQFQAFDWEDELQLQAARADGTGPP